MKATNISMNKILYFLFPTVFLLTLALYPFLPDNLPMQFGLDGEVNWTLPKIIGIWPFYLVALACALYRKDSGSAKTCFSIVLLLLVHAGSLIYLAFFR